MKKSSSGVVLGGSLRELGWQLTLSRLLILLALVGMMCPSGAFSQDMKNFSFHVDATTGNGTEGDITGLTLVGVTLIGSSTSDRAVTFEVADSIGTFTVVKCLNIDTLVTVDGATLTGNIPYRFQCPVGGFKKFRVRISGGSTGNLTAVGLGLSKAFRGVGNTGGGDGGGGSGNVIVSGTPASNQLAQWVDSFHIQGLSIVTPLLGGTGVASLPPKGVIIGQGTAPVTSAVPTGNSQCLMSASINGSTTDPSFQTCLTGSSPPNFILDLGDNGINESIALSEIATINDPNAIFTAPSSNKLLIDVNKKWPASSTSDAFTSNAPNCVTPGQHSGGVSASGAAEDCSFPGWQYLLGGTVANQSLTVGVGASLQAANGGVIAATTAQAFALDPSACVANNFVVDIAANGTLNCVQPSFSNISGVIADSQVPDLNVLSTGLTASRCVETDASGNLVSASGLCGVPGGGTGFNAITNGTNNTATMIVGTGGSLSYSGAGLLNASRYRGNDIVAVGDGGTGATPGADDRLLVSDSANSATWRTLPNCGGLPLIYTTGTNAFGCAAGSSNISFADIISGTNSTATMTVTTGGSIVPTASGSIIATGASTNPPNCAAGSLAAGVDANFAAEGCVDVATQAELDAHTSLNNAHNAVSTNTASRIVLRDASGNFAAGTITAALTGNASTATALAADPPACSANTFANDIAANGTLGCVQPNFSNLAGIATDGQIPHLNVLSTGLTPSRCIETDGTGNLTVSTTTCNVQPDYAKLNGPQIVTQTQLVPRVVAQTITSNAFTVNLDTTDIADVPVLAAGVTVNAPTATGSNPRAYHELTIVFAPTSTPRTITWNTIFSEAAGIPLPISTVGDGTSWNLVKVLYNSTLAKYVAVASTSGVTRGVTTLASSSTYTCNPLIAESCEMQNTAAGGTGITLAIPAGTYVNGTKLLMRVRCTGTQALTLPTGTFLGSTSVPLTGMSCTSNSYWTQLGFIYSLVDTRWQLHAFVN